jgi:hypothetical protein
MALTPDERSILKHARASIQSEREDFVCHALSDAEGYTNDAARLKQYVMRMLEGQATLELWISKKYGFWPSREMARKARIAWITWMLDGTVDLDAKTERDFLFMKKNAEDVTFW